MGFTITIAPPRPQRPPPKISCSQSCWYEMSKMRNWQVSTTHKDFHCVHLMDLQNTCLEKSSKNSSTCTAAERFRKRPQIKNINISLDVCKIHLEKRENDHFQVGLLTPLEPPWGPPQTPLGPTPSPRALPGSPWRPPRTPKRWPVTCRCNRSLVTSPNRQTYKQTERQT